MLKSWRIFVQPEYENTICELGLYSWRVNANGDPIPEPEPGHDHIPDTIRYALGKAITGEPVVEYQCFDVWD